VGSFLADRHSIGLVNRGGIVWWDHTGQEPELVPPNPHSAERSWEGMQSLLDLPLLVDKYAEILPHLELDGDKQEKYSTMLLWLQNQVEGGTPNPRIVDRCLEYLSRVAGDRLQRASDVTAAHASSWIVSESLRRRRQQPRVLVGQPVLAPRSWKGVLIKPSMFGCLVAKLDRERQR